MTVLVRAPRDEDKYAVLVRAPRRCEVLVRAPRTCAVLVRMRAPDQRFFAPDVTVLVRALDVTVFTCFGKSPARDVTGLAKSESPFSDCD